jgi:hypothetical protein
MNQADTLPFGATASAGSQAFLSDPAPGIEIGAAKLLPPFVERAKPIPVQPIHSS